VTGAVPAELGPLWEDLASADASRADFAIWRLVGGGPPAVAMLRERLNLLPIPTDERIAALIADLDNEDFATRQRANAELAECIEAAAPLLRKAMDPKPGPEVRRRLQALLAGVDQERAPEQRRHVRAARILAEIADADSRSLLKHLSQGDQRFVLTREAGAALIRLENR